MATKGIFLSAFLLPLTFPVIAHSAFWSPHVGIDYKYWGLKPDVYYEDLFPRINNSFNVYAGSRINGYFGFDFGFEESENKRRSQEFIGDDTEAPFGQFELPGNAATIEIRLKSLHLDLNFYWQVFHRFEIIFMTGIAFLYPSTHVFHLENGNWVEYRNETIPKVMGRIGIGAQYNILPCLGIKALFNWDPDKRINYIGFDENDVAYDIHPYNTSTSFNLGIVYSFSSPRRHTVVEFIDPYDADF